MDDIAQIKATAKAEALLEATEILGKYALKTKSVEALNLIEQAQQDLLSLPPTNPTKDE